MRRQLERDNFRRHLFLYPLSIITHKEAKDQVQKTSGLWADNFELTAYTQVTSGRTLIDAYILFYIYVHTCIHTCAYMYTHMCTHVQAHLVL